MLVAEVVERRTEPVDRNQAEIADCSQTGLAERSQAGHAEHKRAGVAGCSRAGLLANSESAVRRRLAANTHESIGPAGVISVTAAAERTLTSCSRSFGQAL